MNFWVFPIFIANFKNWKKMVILEIIWPNFWISDFVWNSSDNQLCQFLQLWRLWYPLTYMLFILFKLLIQHYVTEKLSSFIQLSITHLIGSGSLNGPSSHCSEFFCIRIWSIVSICRWHAAVSCQYSSTRSWRKP